MYFLHEAVLCFVEFVSFKHVHVFGFWCSQELEFIFWHFASARLTPFGICLGAPHGIASVGCWTDTRFLKRNYAAVYSSSLKSLTLVRLASDIACSCALLPLLDCES